MISNICMELYSMPQLDKASSVYADSQFEGGGDVNQRDASNDVKKFAPVPSDTLPLLTSSAWNAVIHRPAEDDSEPDDLPSTVDMDAIKGSPATPLTASKGPSSMEIQGWAPSRIEGGKQGNKSPDEEDDDDDDDDDEEDDDDNDNDNGEVSDSEDSEDSDSQESDDGDSGDSGSLNESGSDSEGSDSESCWSDSDSDSESSSCSSHSGHSSQSSQPRQTFSIRDQGGLKLKIVTKKGPSKEIDVKKSPPSCAKINKEKVVKAASNQLRSSSHSPTMKSAATKANAAKKLDASRKKTRTGHSTSKEKQEYLHLNSNSLKSRYTLETFYVLFHALLKVSTVHL